ncbi:MAG: rhamnogalacturonan acetylesterase [Paludibacter sp.]|nr:rhamnogalacturonan acetylesterase [Paludibacter sp.]
MKIKFIILCLLSFCMIQAKTRIFTIGDSTMADYDTVKYSGDKEQRGWCQLFPTLLSDEVTLINAAKNGRSSKSFYKEVWVKLRDRIQPGDYVFIQFGHNDEKQNGMDTDENDSTGRGTNPWSLYQKYLKLYVNEARERGAIPVLFTPVVRRYFKDNKLTQKAQHNLVEIASDTTLNYVASMKSVAKKLSVPLIDMTASTKKLVESYGPDKAKKELFINTDDTHLKAEGARQFAKLAAKELKEKNILTKYIQLK